MDGKARRPQSYIARLKPQVGETVAFYHFKLLQGILPELVWNGILYSYDGIRYSFDTCPPLCKIHT